MREQLIQYIRLLFAGTPNSEDMLQEILQNTLDRYDDLIAQGKSPEAAYRLAISGIGDINEIIGTTSPQSTPDHSLPPLQTDKDAAKNKKMMQAVAIGLYICCVIPLFVLEGIGNGIIGLCLMFLMIAAATGLLILSSGEEKEDKEKVCSKQKNKSNKASSSGWGWLPLVIYLAISFWSGAWGITWLIFPISGAIEGLVRACHQLKEGNIHED